MKIVNSEEMKMLESAAKTYGIDEILMMEHAAISLYLSMEEEFGNLTGKKILIVAGKGNNGGDAMAIARNLLETGAIVKVYLVLGEPSGELAKKQLSILRNLGVICKILPDGQTLVEDIVDDIKSSDIIIDGLLGTGAKGKPNGELEKFIDIINENSKFTVSVDVPTGLNCDTGNILGTCIHADMTVTFGFMKIGMLLYPGKEFCGKVKIGKIGIPCGLENELKGEITTFDDAKSLLPKRPRFSNKGTFGKVLIISGSANYTGTPTMVSYSALRVGAGLATAAVPEPFNAIVTSRLPEAISIPLPSKNGYISEKALDLLGDLAEKADVVAIGPGLGMDDGVKECVKWIISNVKKPLVIDADGLNSIKGEVKNLHFNERMIITPHPGEFSRLISTEIFKILKAPVKYAIDFAVSEGVNILLKGPTTVIAQPDGKYFLNATGNTGLAKGGTGDILTGMIAGFMAQGLNAIDAARLAAYIHGRSAEIYAKNKNEASMLPEDLIDIIPDVLFDLNR